MQIDVRKPGRERDKRGTSQRAAMTGSRLTVISVSCRRVRMLAIAALISENPLLTPACSLRPFEVGTIRLPCRSNSVRPSPSSSCLMRWLTALWVTCNSRAAEHGAGLNMAPFLESEWGAKATAMMWRLKELADPKGILGPNVILTRNAKLHLENLKSVPQIENVTDFRNASSGILRTGLSEP